MTESYKHFEKIVKEINEAELGNMFGKPCGKLDNKGFVSFFENEMVSKIGREDVESLLKKYEILKDGIRLERTAMKD